MYIILDPRDNSVTFSERLFARITADHGGPDGTQPARAFIQRTNFRSSLWARLIAKLKRQTPPPVYAIVINPDVPDGTCVADIQHNPKYKCIGFETLCPTVLSILWEMRIYGYARPIKKRVRPARLPNGITVYKF